MTDDALTTPFWLHLPIDRIGLWLGPALMVGWIHLGPTGDLSPEAHRLAGILLLTITWWLTEPIPIPATALLSVSLCVFLGAIPGAGTPNFKPAQVALEKLAEPSVYFLLGGLFLGRAMTRHGLDRRLALSLLCTNWAGRSPGTLLAALGLAVATISMWVSNTAATAMMYPVTLGIIAVLAAGSTEGEARFARSPYASGLLMMTAYASSVGGIATPIGTATNVFALGTLRNTEYLGRSADFLRWTLVGVPMMLVIMLGLTWWMNLRSPATGLDMPSLRGFLREQQRSLGRWKRGEINTLLVFLFAVCMWVAPGVRALTADTKTADWFTRQFPEEIVAIMIPVLLFLLPVDWKERKFSLEPDDLAKVDWGVILLFGCGLSLGNLMFKTGLAESAGKAIFQQLESVFDQAGLGAPGVWTITAVAIVAGIVLSEFTSNVAAATALLPVVLAISKQAGVDPVPPLFGVTFAASFGSALPVSTPPNAIVYGSGLLPVRRMIVAGLGMDLLCAIVIWIVLRAAFALGWSPFAS